MANEKAKNSNGGKINKQHNKRISEEAAASGVQNSS